MTLQQAPVAAGAVLDDATVDRLFPVALRCSGCERVIARAQSEPCAPTRTRCRRCGAWNVWGMLLLEGGIDKDAPQP